MAYKGDVAKQLRQAGITRGLRTNQFAGWQGDRATVGRSVARLRMKAALRPDAMASVRGKRLMVDAKHDIRVLVPGQGFVPSRHID
jgi:hypothetical protein